MTHPSNPFALKAGDRVKVNSPVVVKGKKLHISEGKIELIVDGVASVRCKPSRWRHYTTLVLSMVRLEPIASGTGDGAKAIRQTLLML